LKLKTVLEFGGIVDAVGKPLKSDLTKFIPQFSELRWGRY
jgi:hypothetical protein